MGPLPDSLRLSANEKQLTVGLRGTPAQVAIVDTETFDYDSVTIEQPLNLQTVHEGDGRDGETNGIDVHHEPAVAIKATA